MVTRLTVITTLIALFGLSFSVIADNARHRSFGAFAAQESQDCLAGGLLCAPRNDEPGF